MTVRGQVTIPADVRAALGLEPGDIVMFEQGAGGVRVAKDADIETPSFEDRLARARALSNPLPLGMMADEYMALLREPLPPSDP